MKPSQILNYAKKVGSSATIKLANYITKLKTQGYNDTDIMHKIYNNFNFVTELGHKSLQLVGANPKHNDFQQAFVDNFTKTQRNKMLLGVINAKVMGWHNDKIVESLRMRYDLNNKFSHWLIKQV